LFSHVSLFRKCSLSLDPSSPALSRPEWLQPELTHQDAALLSSMGVAAPEKMPGDLRCARCGLAFRAEIDFLILPDGTGWSAKQIARRRQI